MSKLTDESLNFAVETMRNGEVLTSQLLRIENVKLEQQIESLTQRNMELEAVVEVIKNHFKVSTSQSISYHRKFVKEALSRLGKEE